MDTDPLSGADATNMGDEFWEQLRELMGRKLDEDVQEERGIRSVGSSRREDLTARKRSHRYCLSMLHDRKVRCTRYGIRSRLLKSP